MSAVKEGYGDVFAVCPKLVPLNLQQTIWQGFIRVHVSIIPEIFLTQVVLSSSRMCVIYEINYSCISLISKLMLELYNQANYMLHDQNLVWYIS